MRLECEDGWGLLRRWRPDGVYAWTGKTIAWLLAEVLCRATGLGCLCDGASNWTTVLDSFVLMPATENVPGAQAAAQRERRALPRSLTVRGSGLAAVQALLAKAGGSARWQPDSRLFCYVPWKQTLVDPYIIGSGDEILDALYGRGLVAPNQVAVFDAQHAALATAPSALAGPRRYLSTLVDLHLTSSLACLEYASAATHAADAQRFLGWVETPCQCQLELGDLLWLQDERAGELQGVYLRAAALAERYAPAEGTFTTRVTLEGA